MEDNKKTNYVAERIVTEPVKRKKRSAVSRFLDTFVQEDANTISNHFLMNILIPTLKKTALETLEYIFYPDQPSKKSSKPYSYNDISSGKRYRDEPQRTRYSYDEIIIPTRAKAFEVRDQMKEVIREYNFVRVADYYAFCGVSHEWTDNDWGWTDISNADIVSVRDGYIIKLPRPMPIDR